MRIARIAAQAAAVCLVTAAVAAAQQPAAPPAAKPELKVVKTEAVHALVLPMKGSYMQHPEAFSKLTTALADLGVAATGPMFARYHSGPETAEADLFWEVGIPVPASVTKVPEPFDLQDIPATKVAAKMHRGPMEELGSAWPVFVGEVMAAGHMISGAAIQIFGADGLEMRLPIQ